MTKDDTRFKGDFGSDKFAMVLVTEKMDGECTTMYRDHIHARSVSSGHHPSRSWVKGFHAGIRDSIPEGWRVVGENCFAKHSIHYTELPSYFLVFAVIDENEFSQDWETTLQFCLERGLHTVPELYRGPWDENVVRECHTGASQCGGEQEGYVVRDYLGFYQGRLQESVAKYVRKGHVQTDEHWMTQKLVKNELEK